MTSDHTLGSRRGASALTIGIPLASLWAFQTAAADVPGAGFIRLPVVLGMATTILAWRLSSPKTRRRSAHKNGVTLGFSCWGVAATFSALLHWQAPHVPLTYLSMCLAGSAVYLALSGLNYKPGDLDGAIVGLAVGTLFSIATNVATLIGDGTIAGNAGHMAGVLLIVTPILAATACDRSKGPLLRIFCGATLIPVALSLWVLQQPAAFVTISLVIPLVCLFKLGIPRLPVVAGAFVLGAGALLLRMQPEWVAALFARLQPVVTAATGDALSTTWLVGTGPGAGSTDVMETGILGLVGITLLSIGVLVSLCRVLARGRQDHVNDTRFALIIGPAAYLIYSLLAHSAPDNAGATTWLVLVASMLALMPPFGRRARVSAARANAVSAEPSSHTGFVQRPQSIPSLAR